MTDTPQCPYCAKAPALKRIGELRMCSKCREKICALARKQREL
jgi:ribosomal protein L37AE/L43A